MTPAERDAAMRDIAHRISVLTDGTPIDITVGGCLVMITAQLDRAKNLALDKYVADKFRQIANLIDPP